MPAIPKPLAEITYDDLETICKNETVEDEQLDFKETIPNRDGEGRDPWRDERRIRDYGRDQLLAAVVAFANSYGGDLIVGVKDGGGKPGRAEELTPIADCEDAAHRLLQAANACIEPPIRGLGARAIVTKPDGSGVLVLRTSRSRDAPHRLTTTKECYQRIRHETLAMSMRQIQDLTFNVARGLEAIDGRFTELRNSFHRWIQLDRADADLKIACLRVTCVAEDPRCYLERVHGIDLVRPRQRRARLEISAGQTYEVIVPFDAYNWRPLLRGTGAEQSDTRGKARMQLYCDGAVTYECAFHVLAKDDDETLRGSRRTHILYPGWLFGIIVNAIESADRFREAAGASATEYAVEIEIAATHPLPVTRLGERVFLDTAGTIPAHLSPYPRYALGPKDTWPDTLTLIWRDFWNSIGVPEGSDRLRLDPQD